jgi:WD40 repeat protein
MQGFTEFSFHSVKCAEDIYGLAINITGTFFVLGHYFSDRSVDKTNISKWEIGNMKRTTLLADKEIRYPHKIQISISDEKIIFISEHNLIHVIDLETLSYNEHPYKDVINISLAKNNLIAVSGNHSSLVDLITMKEIYRFYEESIDSHIHININFEGTKVYAANLKREEIAIINIPEMTCANKLDDAPQEIIYASLNCNDSYYYCCSAKNSGESIWNISKRQKILQKIFKNSSGASNPFVNFHPFLPIIASGSKKGLVMLFNLETESILSMQTISEFPVRSLLFVPSGELLLVATGDGYLHFLDISSLQNNGI